MLILVAAAALGPLLVVVESVVLELVLELVVEVVVLESLCELEATESLSWSIDVL